MEVVNQVPAWSTSPAASRTQSPLVYDSSELPTQTNGFLKTCKPNKQTNK